MRILMVARPASGGMKEHVLELACGLAARGHDVEFAAPDDTDIAGAARARGFTVHSVPIVSKPNPVQDPRAVRMLQRIIYDGRYDIVHAHGFKAGFIGRLAVRLSGIGVRPFVVTAHTHVLTRSTTSAATRWQLRTVERSLERYVTRYIAVSDSVARELLEAYNMPAEKVAVVHDSIDLAPFEQPRDRAAARLALGVGVDAPVVGLAASFSAHKGIRDLIDAVPEIARRVPGVRVVIGGSGALESQLRSQATAVGCNDSIVWPGHVIDMPRFLAALDVFVSPVRSETFGVALIEAAAAGVPTVATRVGAVTEFVLDGVTGLLVDPNDSEALAQAIVGLLDDRRTAAKLADRARERVRTEYSAQRMVEGTLAVYAEALAVGGGEGTPAR